MVIKGHAILRVKKYLRIAFSSNLHLEFNNKYEKTAI
jgi:hypothetical protein